MLGVRFPSTQRAFASSQTIATSVTGGANPLAVHDPGKIVTDLAVAVALGGDAACDIAVLRAQPGCSARWRRIRRCLG